MTVRPSILIPAALSAVALLQSASGAVAQGAAVSEVVVRPARAVDTNAPSEKVRFGDLDINQKAGAATLLKRIQKAATHVCAIHKGDRPSNPDYQSCLHKAVSDAVSDVGNPTVSAAYGEGH